MNKIYAGIAAALVVVFSLYTFQYDTVTAYVNSEKNVIAPHKDISITFTKSMKEKTFTDKTVTLVNNDGDKVKITHELSKNGKTLVIRAPATGYDSNKQFQLSISKSVTSKEGQNLASNVSFTFQTNDKLTPVETKETFLTILSDMYKKQKKLDKLFPEAASKSFEGGNDASTTSFGNNNSTNTSNTNVQVEGVDEADILKTDGEHFYYVRKQAVKVTKAKPADKSKVIRTIQENDFNPSELYLYKNRLVAIGSGTESMNNQKQTNKKRASSERNRDHQTAVFIYNISNPSSPKKVREVVIKGSYKTSRLINEHLYFMTNEQPSWRVVSENKDLNDSSNTKEELRPIYKDSATSDGITPVPYNNIYQLPGSVGLDFLTITSLDISKDDKKANVKAFFGADNTVYMSKDTMYLAVHDIPLPKDFAKEVDSIERKAETNIYQFNMEGNHVTYHATTKVPGKLINQFAMDERKGVFRVATTKGVNENDEKPTTNNLYTFDKSMNPLGKLEGLAKGERIYSVRFMQERAYLVTFKQIDPLFVIDLAEPESPKVLGKLKIPGFSNYLHPIGEDHVIGFGKQTKQVGNNQIKTAGVKLSLFDISDVTNPIEKDVVKIGGRGTNSKLSENHKVLYFNQEKNLFGFPIMVNEEIDVTANTGSGDHIFSHEGAYVYHVTAEDGFRLKKVISHQPNKDLRYPEWDSRMQRMMSINNTLYTFSEDRMEAMNLSTEEKVAEVKFSAQ